MDYKTISYVALGLLAALYIINKIVRERVFKKLVRAEVEQVLTAEEHKVKGRYE